jgi:hypothetical protein
MSNRRVEHLFGEGAYGGQPWYAIETSMVRWKRSRRLRTTVAITRRFAACAQDPPDIRDWRWPAVDA